MTELLPGALLVGGWFIAAPLVLAWLDDRRRHQTICDNQRGRFQ